LKREGLSAQAISKLTGYDRETVRKYLLKPETVPRYGPRSARPSKLDPHKPYLQDRMKAVGVECPGAVAGATEAGLPGRLYDFEGLAASATNRRGGDRRSPVRTPPGKQAQVDWGHLGYLDTCGQVWGFAITLGYSRRMWAQAALDQKLGTLLRMHEAAFREWGAVPEEILYDRMKTVWLGSDERGEIVWHPVFLDFARYWGFRPRLCRPYRAQTKGKIESGVKYVRRNFVCGLLGREPSCLMDFNTELRQWVDGVANQRVHGTTRELVLARWDMDQFSMQVLNGRSPYPYSDDELRKVARDAYVSWQASRYSVPWQYVGKEVWVRQQGLDVEVHYSGQRIAVHARAERRHQIITHRPHHQGIPLGSERGGGKILVQMRETAPSVEVRSLAAYESVAMGGAR
jgi:transposase